MWSPTCFTCPGETKSHMTVKTSKTRAGYGVPHRSRDIGLIVSRDYSQKIAESRVYTPDQLSRRCHTSNTVKTRICCTDTQLTGNRNRTCHVMSSSNPAARLREHHHLPGSSMRMSISPTSPPNVACMPLTSIMHAKLRV